MGRGRVFSLGYLPPAEFEAASSGAMASQPPGEPREAGCFKPDAEGL